MTALESIAELQNRTRWQLADIQELSEDTWIARATTTHFKESGEAEQSFGIIARGYVHFPFPLDALPIMATWCQEQSKQ